MSITNAKSTCTASKASKKTTPAAQAEAANTALRDIPVSMVSVSSLVHSTLNVRKQALMQQNWQKALKRSACYKI